MPFVTGSHGFSEEVSLGFPQATGQDQEYKSLSH